MTKELLFHPDIHSQPFDIQAHEETVSSEDAKATPFGEFTDAPFADRAELGNVTTDQTDRNMPVWTPEAALGHPLTETKKPSKTKELIFAGAASVAAVIAGINAVNAYSELFEVTDEDIGNYNASLIGENPVDNTVEQQLLFDAIQAGNEDYKLAE